MEIITTLIIPVILLFALLRIIMLPVKWGIKIFLNSACGFLCLWLLNSISGFTGFAFPINSVTALIAGFLGLPGIVLLAILQWVL